MSATKNMVESLREVVQDLLVPEFKALKVPVDSLHTEMQSMRTEMKLRDDRMEQIVRSGDERLEQLVRSGDERNETAIRALSQKLDYAIDIRERLATLQARLPRQ